MAKQRSSKAGSEVQGVDTDIKNSEKRSNQNVAGSIARDESRSNLTRSNIGANSMQKLTGVASRAQLIPQADMQNEI